MEISRIAHQNERFLLEKYGVNGTVSKTKYCKGGKCSQAVYCNLKSQKISSNKVSCNFIRCKLIR